MGRWVIVAVMLATLPAAGQETVRGWSVQYQYDAFSRKTFAIAFLSESGKDIGPAQLQIGCAVGGGLIFSFNPGGLTFGIDAEDIGFRGSDGVEVLRFSPLESRDRGKVAGLSAKDGARLRALFLSGVESLPYKGAAAQGAFVSAGSKEAFGVMDDMCGEATK